MATAVNKPELDDQLDWGAGSDDGQAAAVRPARGGDDAASGSSRAAGPFVALADWRDSHRMRRNLRRGAGAAIAGGASAGGVRELWYRVDDWRIDRKALRYDRNARRAPRRGGLIAAVVVGLALLAM